MTESEIDSAVYKASLIFRNGMSFAIGAKKEDLTIMKTPQEKAAELLPFVQALANGEKVMQSVDNGEELDSNGNFIYGLTYSIKPKMMLVNGFEVPEPMCVAPRYRSKCYSPGVNNDNFLLEDH